MDVDPNLFYLDYARLFEVLIAIVILAFLLERALSLLFESRFFIKHGRGKSLKELIAFVVGIVVCWYWDFDAISMIFLKAKVTYFGAALTGAIVAGGSKASIKLFRDVFGFMSTAEEKRLAIERADVKGGKRK